MLGAPTQSILGGAYSLGARLTTGLTTLPSSRHLGSPTVALSCMGAGEVPRGDLGWIAGGVIEDGGGARGW